METFCLFQRLQQSASSLEALQATSTPLFRSGLLISRTAWYGRIVSFGWKIAGFLGLANEREELVRIHTAALEPFQAIQRCDFQMPSTRIRSIVALQYIPQYAERITSLACSLLGCSRDEWSERIQEAQRAMCLDLVDRIALSALSYKALTNLKSLQKEQWLRELEPYFIFLPSGLLWDCFKRVLREQKAEMDDTRLSSFALELQRAGCALDAVLDRKSPQVMGSSCWRLSDPRFCCYLLPDQPIHIPIQELAEHLPTSRSLNGAPSSMLQHGLLRNIQIPSVGFCPFQFLNRNVYKRMVLSASNGFLIPLWRAVVAEKQTLFRVVDCYGMAGRSAYIEGLQGRVQDVLHEDTFAFRSLCFSIKLWISSRARFHPRAEDLWVTSAGTLVSFEPVYEREPHFSIVEVERCIHALHLPQELHMKLLQAVGFFDSHDVVVAENILKRGRQESVHEELISHGIDDPELYKAILRLLHEVQDYFAYQKRTRSEGRLFQELCTAC